MTISSLEIGQTLSGDVHITNGRRLFSSGHVITEQTLRVLKIWGVRELPLEELSDEDFADMLSNEECTVLADRSAVGIQTLYGDIDTDVFPISCLLKDSIRLANSCGKNCDGFFAYLYPPSATTLQAFSSNDCISHIDVEDAFSGYDDFPKDFFTFTNMLNDVYVTSEAVVAAIEKNNKVKCKLLKICDALIHVSNCEVKSIYSCTAFLGNRTVLYLAIMLVYIHHVQESYNSTVIMHHGRCSITTGIAARYIAAAVGVYGRECFFSNGLLQDIGCMFYSRSFTSTYEKVREKVLCGGAELCVVEERYLGINHAELGGHILKRLGFPASMEKSVREHQISFSEVNTKENAVMHVAESIAKALTFDPVYDVPLSSVDSDAWKMLNITEATLSELVNTIYLKSKEIIRLAYGE